MLATTGDAFGLALRAGLEGRRSWHALERDDGYVDAMSVEPFFAEPQAWPEGEDRVLQLAEGRVLDIGVGAGRFALPLQGSGHEVVGLDTSAGAIDVSRTRGVKKTFTGTIFDFPSSEPFDTFLLAGHNLGLLESPESAPAFLARLEALARPGARLIGTGRDPATDDPDHLAYHELNRRRGRPAGQVRLRVRFRAVMTPWFDYWYQSPDALAGVLSAGGWELRTVWPVAGGSYLAVAGLS